MLDCASVLAPFAGVLANELATSKNEPVHIEPPDCCLARVYFREGAESGVLEVNSKVWLLYVPSIIVELENCKFRFGALAAWAAWGAKTVKGRQLISRASPIRTFLYNFI